MARRKNNVSWGNRLWLILTTITIVAATFVEMSVALNFEFAEPWTRGAMWLGSILWFIVAVMGAFLATTKKTAYPFGYALIPVAFAACSIAGLYKPWLTTYVLWINAALFLLFCAAQLWMLPKVWKDKDYDPPFMS